MVTGENKREKSRQGKFLKDAVVMFAEAQPYDKKYVWKPRIANPETALRDHAREKIEAKDVF